MHKLLNIMQQLREKCPWDQKQTPQSLTRYAIEEAYEVEAAVREDDAEHVKEELGDLLLQVVFQAQMYSEQGAFDFQDVVDNLCKKLVRRHPHVFEAEKFNELSAEQVSELWQNIKAQEKQEKAAGGHHVVSRLDQIKPGPALTQAEAIQKNVAKVGFDFEQVTDAYEKLEEELAELNEAILHNNSDEMQDEFGDCLFSLINVGRKLGISSEMALLGTIYKFKARFAYIEDQAAKQQMSVEQMSLQEMDELWNQAKCYLKQKNELQSLELQKNHQVQHE